MQRALNRIPVGYLEQALVFGVREITFDHDRPGILRCEQADQ